MRHRTRFELSSLIGIERVSLRTWRRVPDRRHAVKPARCRASFGFGALPVPFGPLPIFMPPIAVPGSPENQAWVRWTLHQVNDACERLGFRNEADAEINGSGPLEARGFPTGVWPADKGSEEWGRRNGIGAKEGKRRFHDIKKGDSGSKPKDVYGVDPESGEVYDPEGEVIGNLGD